jgi:hypothetical protein
MTPMQFCFDEDRLAMGHAARLGAAVGEEVIR